MGEVVWNDPITQLFSIAVFILIVAFIVSIVRPLVNRSEPLDKRTVIHLILDIALLLVLWFVLEWIGVNTFVVIPYFIEWATKFILPWIVLYWLVRLIKSLERK